jgi:hypothetical protein
LTSTVAAAATKGKRWYCRQTHPSRAPPAEGLKRKNKCRRPARSPAAPAAIRPVRATTAAAAAGRPKPAAPGPAPAAAERHETSARVARCIRSLLRRSWNVTVSAGIQVHGSWLEKLDRINRIFRISSSSVSSVDPVHPVNPVECSLALKSLVPALPGWAL